MNTAIIVAAGSGTRFNSDIPKQFVLLSGKPLLHHTLERFEASDEIGSVVLVLPADEVEAFESSERRSRFLKLKSVVAGGDSRAGSVHNGFLAVTATDGVVAIHDGARPLVTPAEIDATVRKAAEEGAACLVAPVADTIKQVDGGDIVGTLDRRTLRRAMTPQAFRYELLKEMFDKWGVHEHATDECYLVEQMGHKIATVAGSGRNIKITQPEDLFIAEAFLAAAEVN